MIQNTQEFIVAPNQAKMRLDLFLVPILSGYSRAQIQKMVKNGDIAVNGKKATPHFFLQEGDRVTHSVPQEKPSAMIPEIEVIAETPDYLVINKPSGVVVHPDSRHKSGTVVDFLVQFDPQIAKVGENPTRPGIVHRLDKEASGLLLVAKTEESYRHFKKQFQTRVTEKEYTVLVHGGGLASHGEIDSAIARATSGRMKALPKAKRVVDLFKLQEKETGRDARTLYNVLEARGPYTLLSVQTKTGRTHQIRVHFFSIG